MHNLLIHYLKGQWLAIGLIAFMLTLQALVFCGISYGVDAMARMADPPTAEQVAAKSASVAK